MWRARERHGLWPSSGGWEHQPLPLLVQIEAIDLVHKTYIYKNSKNSDWSKLTKTQLELITELDKAMLHG